MNVSGADQSQNTGMISFMQGKMQIKAGQEQKQKFREGEAPVVVTLSKEGLAAWRKEAASVAKNGGYESPDDLPIMGAGEEYWARGAQMREVVVGLRTSANLGQNNNRISAMNIVKEAYGIMYDRIVKDHEDGDWQVKSFFSGRMRSVSLEEDMKALKWCFSKEVGLIQAGVSIW